MYQEIKSLLSRGERVVVTGMKGTGKSVLVSKFSTSYNIFRSMWYVSEHLSKGFYDKYDLFDRVNYVDRYAYQYSTSDALDACVEGYHNYLSNTYLILMFDDRFRSLRTQKKLDKDKRNELVNRFLDIGSELWRKRIIKGLVLSTQKGWWSTDYADFDKMITSVREEFK